MTDHLPNGTWSGDWVVDPNGSSVRFRSASMWGFVKVTGRFAELRGQGSFDSDGAAAGALVVDVSSVDTGNKRRDKHLRSDDFLRAATHPEITYTVSGIVPDGPGRVRVTGELRILDHVHPLELTATLDESDPTGATLAAETELDQATWGIVSRMISKTTQVEVRLRFTAGPTPAS
jgi:polyisoprenoid-binding protein YceI